MPENIELFSHFRKPRRAWTARESARPENAKWLSHRMLIWSADDVHAPRCGAMTTLKLTALPVASAFLPGPPAGLPRLPCGRLCPANEIGLSGNLVIG